MKRPRKPDELCVALDEISESGHHLSCRKHPRWVAENLQEEKTIDCGFAEDIRIGLDFFKTGLRAALQPLIIFARNLSLPHDNLPIDNGGFYYE